MSKSYGATGSSTLSSVDGSAISGYDDLAAQLASKQPGEEVMLTIQRGAAEQQVTVTLQARTA